MTDQATRVVPAGWYDDPASPARVRWWNGIAWTEHVADKPSPEEQAAARAAAEQRAAEEARHRAEAETAARIAEARRLETEFGIGTSEQPIVAGHDWTPADTDHADAADATGGELRRDRSGRADRYLRPEAGTATGPAWLIALSPLLTLTLTAAAGYVYLFFIPNPLLFAGVGVVYLLTLLWAFADARTLRARGFEPVSGAFALLGGLVYLIARRVRVRGIGPLLTFLLLALGAVGVPVAVFASGIAAPTIQALQIQDELNRELVGGGVVASINCPLVPSGVTYTCDAVMPDGEDRRVWVSLDDSERGFSNAFAVN